MIQETLASQASFFHILISLAAGICLDMPAKAKVKPNVMVGYEGNPEEDELTPEDVESIKEAIMDVIMGRTMSFNELLDELVKEGKLTKEEADKLREL